MYNIIDEFNKVINKTQWIDAEDYYEIEPFLRQAEIEIERQAVRNERERIIKWAEKYMDKTTKYYGTDKHGIDLDDLLQELQNK
jgi:hypothetical protein